MPNMVYNVGMIKTYTLEDPKPDFKYGTVVEVDMAHLGSPSLGVLTGRVVGKGSVHVIDFWLVEFNRDFAPTYPYRVFTVPHVAILK
jgi:hypothetical protein